MSRAKPSKLAAVPKEPRPIGAMFTDTTAALETALRHANHALLGVLDLKTIYKSSIPNPNDLREVSDALSEVRSHLKLVLVDYLPELRDALEWYSKP
jgi:hypothetical protein